MRAEIKKGKGLDGIIEEHKPAQAEETLEEKTTGDNVLDEIMKRYEETLGKEVFTEATKYLDTIEDIPTPQQINSVLQATIKHEQHKDYSWNTGAFITRLIQNSYEAGYNDFTLKTQNLKPLDEIGYELKGTQDNKIRITIQGNIRHHFGRHSTNCEYRVLGDTGDECGAVSTNCKFEIEENTGGYLGLRSISSDFNITGNTGHNCGMSSKQSTFKTSNPETLKKMKKEVPEDNIIIFIHQDGKEEIVRDYSR